MTTYESNLESSRNIRNIIFDDRHTRFTTFDDQHDVYSMLFVQFFYVYSFIHQHEYVYHSDRSHQHQLFSLSRFVHLNLHQSVKHLRHFALRINTHARSHYLSISFRISMHAHHRYLRFSFLHQHLEIRHHTSRHRLCFESQRISSRNCRN